MSVDDVARWKHLVKNIADVTHCYRLACTEKDTYFKLAQDASNFPEKVFEFKNALVVYREHSLYCKSVANHLGELEVDRERTEAAICRQHEKDTRTANNWAFLTRIVSNHYNENNDLYALPPPLHPRFACSFCDYNSVYFLTDISIHGYNKSKHDLKTAPCFEACSSCVGKFEIIYEKLQWQWWYQFLPPNGPGLYMVFKHVPVREVVESIIAEYCLV